MIIASHSEKYKTASSCSKVIAEGGHTLDDPEGYRSDVDVSQRGRNIIMITRREADARIRKAERAHEASGRKVRKDAVRMFSTVTSFPKSWPDWAVDELAKELYDAHTEILEGAGMDTSYRLGYAIHFDEKSPHMHEYDCPVKDGRLNCKAVLSKATLTKFHEREWEVYEAFAGRHPELEKMASYTHGSERKHMGTQAFKAEKLKEEVSILKEKVSILNGKVSILAKNASELEAEAKSKASERDSIQEDINGLTEDKNALEANFERSMGILDSIVENVAKAVPELEKQDTGTNMPDYDENALEAKFERSTGMLERWSNMLDEQDEKLKKREADVAEREKKQQSVEALENRQKNLQAELKNLKAEANDVQYFLDKNYEVREPAIYESMLSSLGEDKARLEKDNAKLKGMLAKMANFIVNLMKILEKHFPKFYKAFMESEERSKYIEEVKKTSDRLNVKTKAKPKAKERRASERER